MERICIIGGSGTGKTTLAKNLGEQLNLPVYHIDGIHHLENWEIRNKDERDRIILEKVNEDKWVIDGTYNSTLKQRFDEQELSYSDLSYSRSRRDQEQENKRKNKENSHE